MNDSNLNQSIPQASGKAADLWEVPDGSGPCGRSS